MRYSSVYGCLVCVECAVFSALARWSVVRLLACGVDSSELELPRVLPQSSTVELEDVELHKAPTPRARLLKVERVT